ncbi:MAG: 4'-phosphopantetheinyl transferase family protein [Candidatus Dormibacteria bacterium]
MKPLALPAGEIHLWQAECPEPPSNSIAVEVGHRASQAADAAPADGRAGQARLRWVWVRRLLSHYAAVEPSAIQFSRGKLGKPQLSGESQRWLQFNVSHSGSRVFAAVSRGVEVGVDIELTGREGFATGVLAERCFAPEDCAWIEAAPPTERFRRFLELWTRWEALAKSRGVGLRALDVERSRQSLRGSAMGGGWAQVAGGAAVERSVLGFDGGPSCVGAVAIEAAPGRLSFMGGGAEMDMVPNRVVGG